MSIEDRLYQMLGKRIRDERKKADFTQLKLAERVNLTRTSITNIEKGQQKIQVYTLYAIAKALNIPVRNLLPEIELGEKTFEEQLYAKLPEEDKRKWALHIIKPTGEQTKGEQK
jgi:transcriptional regulator with XRE-family HTH domain